MKKKQKQPIPAKGFEFTGWAIFNWGYSLDRVFRTRNDAKAYLIGTGKDGSKWSDISSHYHIAKVKCTVTK